MLSFAFRQVMEFNQNRIHRIFQLIRLMKVPPFRTKEQLGESVGCTVRSIYRYIHLLEDLGFVVKDDLEGRLWLEGGDVHGGLTPNEIEFVVQILTASAPNHALATSIVRKLSAEEQTDTTSESIAEASHMRVLEQCTAAIENRLQLVLVGYASAHSGSIRDRLVEPVSFVHNYQSLSAFEVISGQMKLFKLHRVADAVMTTQPFEHENAHLQMQTDCFGFAWRADQPARFIEMHLSLRAGLVLQEEHPRTKDYISPSSDAEGFDIRVPVADYRAPGRFVKGWGAADAVARGDEGFLAFLVSKPASTPAGDSPPTALDS